MVAPSVAPAMVPSGALTVALAADRVPAVAAAAQTVARSPPSAVP
jgi:hypothetical protein